MTTPLSLLRPLRRLALVAGLGAAMGLVAPAAGALAQDQDGGRPAAGPRGRGPGHGLRQGRVRPDRMADELGLTDAQRAQIRAILESGRAQGQALHQQGADRDALQSHRRQIHEQIQAVLTPEQQQRARELRRQRGQQIMQRRLSHMTEALGLTDAQQSQVQTIVQQSRARAEALLRQARQDGTPPRDALRALRQETKARIDAVLTPAQQARFQELRQAHRGRGHGRGRGGPARDGQGGGPDR